MVLKVLTSGVVCSRVPKL